MTKIQYDKEEEKCLLTVDIRSSACSCSCVVGYSAVMQGEEISHFSSDDDDHDSEEEKEYFPQEFSSKPLQSTMSPTSSTSSSNKNDQVSIEIYAGRLKRRIELIREMRTAYIRDVLLIKQLMTELLTNDERLQLLKQKETTLPSLNLEKFLLSRPVENSFNIIPCHTCGGTVEIVHHDSEEIKNLTAQLQNMDQKKGDFRLIIATKSALLDQIEEKLKVTERKFREEVTLALPSPLPPLLSSLSLPCLLSLLFSRKLFFVMKLKNIKHHLIR